MSEKQRFIEMYQSLDLEQMKEVFERLKADDSTPLGMIMWMAKAYDARYHGKTLRKILQ